VVKGELEHVELGALKGNQGNHNYKLACDGGFESISGGGDLLREFSRDIRSGAVGEVLAAQIPQGPTPIGGPESCVSY